MNLLYSLPFRLYVEIIDSHPITSGTSTGTEQIHSHFIPQRSIECHSIFQWLWTNLFKGEAYSHLCQSEPWDWPTVFVPFLLSQFQKKSQFPRTTQNSIKSVTSLTFIWITDFQLIRWSGTITPPSIHVNLESLSHVTKHLWCYTFPTMGIQQSEEGQRLESCPKCIHKEHVIEENICWLTSNVPSVPDCIATAIVWPIGPSVRRIPRVDVAVQIRIPIHVIERGDSWKQYQDECNDHVEERSDVIMIFWIFRDERRR
jgi:hypothetical protein